VFDALIPPFFIGIEDQLGISQTVGTDLHGLGTD
jgi:hypothetical protein